MSSYGSTMTAPAATKQPRAKLHKRGNSGSSTPTSGPPSALRGSLDAFTTPWVTYEEPTSEISSPKPLVPTPRLKPYLRKSSSQKDDQGKLDLSTSTVENEGLAGLGIQDFGTRTASDVSFSRSSRRTASHSRTVSGCSSASTGSGSFKPTHPFIHPMRREPRPYTPPLGHSSASSLNEEEANESSDMVDDEFKPGGTGGGSYSYHSRRSTSISSTPQIAPTPLSQSHTALDLDPINLGIPPKLTSAPSQSPLDPDPSPPTKLPPLLLHKRSPSAATAPTTTSPVEPRPRASIDRAVSYISRRSTNTEPAEPPPSRSERIRLARAKFDAKEASKDRKAAQKQEARRSRDQARRSEAEEQQQQRASTVGSSRRPSLAALQGAKLRRDSKRDSKDVGSRPYEALEGAGLPVRGDAGFWEEKTPGVVRTFPRRRDASAAAAAKGGWVRFETWVRTRVASCGGERR